MGWKKWNIIKTSSNSNPIPDAFKDVDYGKITTNKLVDANGSPVNAAGQKITISNNSISAGHNHQIGTTKYTSSGSYNWGNSISSAWNYPTQVISILGSPYWKEIAEEDSGVFFNIFVHMDGNQWEGPQKNSQNGSELFTYEEAKQFITAHPKKRLAVREIFTYRSEARELDADKMIFIDDNSDFENPNGE